MQRIVIAVDGSPSSRAALARAADLFPGARATIVSVAEGVEALERASGAARAALPDDVIRLGVERLREEALAAARGMADAACADAAEAGLATESRVVAGKRSIWAAILDVARATEAQVVVCGTRGHGAAVRVLLGSVASGLVHHADRPVLVVPHEAGPATGPILLAYDGSEPAARAVEVAGRLFAGREARVVHVWRSLVRHTMGAAVLRHAPVRDMRDVAGDLHGLFDDLAQETAGRGHALAREHGLGARPTAIESAEAPARVLMRVAEEDDAAAVVVGRRGRSGVAAAMLGSVSASILHGCPRAVLIVNP